MLFAFFVVEIARGSEMIVLGPFLRVFWLFLTCFRLLEPPTTPSGGIYPIRPGQRPDLQLPGQRPGLQQIPDVRFSLRSLRQKRFLAVSGLDSARENPINGRPYEKDLFHRIDSRRRDRP